MLGDAVLNHERLTLPHPRMHQRAFVLVPLRDLAPDMMVLGRPISAWIDEIRDQAIEQMPA
ncbi:2-amino-4-hydroxy-6-hydroxymethyldihydropteridine pyrophosphokinase [compost metagenome]